MIDGVDRSVAIRDCRNAGLHVGYWPGRIVDQADFWIYPDVSECVEVGSRLGRLRRDGIHDVHVRGDARIDRARPRRAERQGVSVKLRLFRREFFRWHFEQLFEKDALHLSRQRKALRHERIHAL